MQTATLWELPFGDGFFISQNGVGSAVRLCDLFSFFSLPGVYLHFLSGITGIEELLIDFKRFTVRYSTQARA